MSKKKTSKIRNVYLTSISKIKDNLNLPVVFLIVIILVYISAHNLSSKKNIEDNSNNITIKENNSEDNNINITNTNINDEIIASDDIDNTKQNESKDNSVTNQNVTSFNKSEPIRNLINDNRGIPVLYYHSVKESADNEVTISPEMLKTELKYIHDQGYITVTISELKAYILNDSPILDKSILITFDDGYMDNYYSAFPILKEFNMTATIFCITSELDGSYYLSKEAIREMSAYGIDIESHTVTHPRLNKMNYDKQLSELVDSKKTLEEITGKEINSIAYPFGDFNDDSVKAAKEAGYTLGFTTKLGLSDRSDNPLTLDRIYISSKYDMNTFKELLNKTKK
jgi:peptidoglycan/xylan/chitin deacetylase (PgdA/CDA1 family)